MTAPAHGRIADNTATRRLFFGLAVPKTLRPALKRARADSELSARARPVPPANWHLTLVFLGAVAEPRQTCIERTAARVAGNTFELTLDQLGHWSRPQVLWAAPTTVPDALTALVESLQAALKTCGFTPETRPYAPHLTLARKVRRVQRYSELAPQTWTIDGFHLYQSVSGPGGVSYPILASWPLHR